MVEGEPTEDGRLVVEGALEAHPPLPLLVSKPDPSGGHAGAEHCGVIEWVHRHDGFLLAEGVCSLEPGVYGCGVDLDATPEMIGKVVTFTAGKVVAVTAYADGTSRPAWPECSLTVEAP